jgi:DNA topoisomerase-2
MSRILTSNLDYSSYSDRKHAIERMAMYAGGGSPIPYENTWVFDPSKGKMVQCQVLHIVPAIERVFMEILTNATDAVNLARVHDVPTGPIVVTMNQSEISVLNTGLPIPIELAVIKDDDERVVGQDSCYVPEQVFGRFRSSSNFEGAHSKRGQEGLDAKLKRLMYNSFSVGQNGTGSKLTNCYSRYFTCTIHDAERHKKYTQTWRDQMKVCEAPILEEYSGDVSSVQITYGLDFSVFNMANFDPSTGIGGYSVEYVALFMKHCIDASYNARNPVSFNGQLFSCDSIRDFAKYYFGETAVKNSVVHLQYPKEVPLRYDDKGLVISAADPKIQPELELLVLDTPDQGSAISFVNCIATREGGEHVDSCIRCVCEETVEKLNSDLLNKLDKKAASLGITDSEKRSLKLTIRDVRPHLSLIVSVRIPYPDLGGQTKEKLNKLPLTVKIPPKTLEVVSRWRLTERLKDEISNKKKYLLTKMGKRGKGTGKTQHANFAGTARGAGQCYLSIVEGDSAKGYWNSLLKWVDGDHDYMGCLPIRGKFINVMKAEEEDILSNEEANELVSALRLERGVNYTIPENRAKLPYAGIIIMTDADTDGKHIIGLLLLFLYHRYPSVIAAGMVSIYRTPVIRCWIDSPSLTNDDIGDECQTFYSIAEYEEWRATADLSKKWVIKYYKGLGGARDSDIEQDASCPHRAFCLWDSRLAYMMELAFSSKGADARKRWLAHYERHVNPVDLQMVDMNWYRDPKLAARLLDDGGIEKHEQLRAVESFRNLPISLFMNHEFIEYGFAANIRAIPSGIDGLKDPVRKIVFAAMNHWKISTSCKYKEYKVAQFSNDVANQSDYEHSEDNLHEVIMNLAQFFVGANNLPLFRAGGQFGSRVDGGKDHPAPRYAFTDPTRVFAYIFRKENAPLLVPQISLEGREVEPRRYYPLVPLHVINGSQGIGYAYRSWFPNHHPLHVIDWLLKRLKGLKPDPLVPWYRGFTGQIQVKDKSKTDAKKGVRQLSSMAEIKEMNLVDQDIPKEIIDKVIDDDEIQDEIEANKAQVVVKFTGSFYINEAGNPVITELPIGRYPNQYTAFLRKKKYCTKIDDKCVGDKVHLTIIGWHKPEDISLKSLFLTKKMSLSNLVCLDENSLPVVYSSIDAVMEAFYLAAIPGYYKRRDMEVAAIADKIVRLEKKKKYAELRKSGQIILDGQNLQSVRDQLACHGLPPDFADAKLSSSMEHKIPVYQDKIDKLRSQMDQRASIPPEDTYSEELLQLAKVVTQELTRIDVKSKKGKHN